MSTRPLLTILLPVRNGAEDLPAYLESASRYADAIVALDDGSTDDTRLILAGHPLVKVLLEKPRRTTYFGWNDAANRNALLDAAGQLDPQWLLSLDADERIDARDGAALHAIWEVDTFRPGPRRHVTPRPRRRTAGIRRSPSRSRAPSSTSWDRGSRLGRRTSRPPRSRRFRFIARQRISARAKPQWRSTGTGGGRPSPTACPPTACRRLHRWVSSLQPDRQGGGLTS